MDAQGTRTVTVQYFGTVATWIGLKEENLMVPADFSSCINEVGRRLEELTQGKLLYTVLYNGRNISLIDPGTARIRDNDVFSVVPVVQGG